MKFITKENNRWVFEFNEDEWILFLEAVSLYPVVDFSKVKLSKSIEEQHLEQSLKLLSEVLKEQADENQKVLQSIVVMGNNAERVDDRFELALTGEQMDTLLQILNDVRIGTWQLLGCPDYKGLELLAKTEKRVMYLIMEICAYFQSRILDAMDSVA